MWSQRTVNTIVKTYFEKKKSPLFTIATPLRGFGGNIIYGADDEQVSVGRYGLPRCVKSSETPVCQVPGRAASRYDPRQPTKPVFNLRSRSRRKTTGRGWLQWQRPSATKQEEVSVQQFLFSARNITVGAVQLRWNRPKWSAVTIPWSWTTYSTRARWSPPRVSSGCSARSRPGSYLRTSRWKSEPAKWWPYWDRKVKRCGCYRILYCTHLHNASTYVTYTGRRARDVFRLSSFELPQESAAAINYAFYAIRHKDGAALKNILARLIVSIKIQCTMCTITINITSITAAVLIIGF